ncbi:MAG: cyclic nucleotide-binding domain-containing protein [Trichodesmium sp. MAG_R02]|jgi:signal-transduction protein with cAMP-binding, CBS, and nucleotidyltransferase domain|nr:cyclic nucleotide-binding domain-containing protein [Trichodesmium sp. MAG_R02]
MTIETIDKVNYLRTVPIFSDCSPQDLSRVIPSTSEHYFKTDETIFNAGAAANELYIIVEGTVRLTSGGRIIDRTYATALIVVAIS